MPLRPFGTSLQGRTMAKIPAGEKLSRRSGYVKAAFEYFYSGQIYYFKNLVGGNVSKVFAKVDKRQFLGDAKLYHQGH
jgi:hypothetical protein